MIGILAGAASGRVVALPAAWIGILATYPVALAVGLIAFLGEGWLTALLVEGGILAVGFLLGTSTRTLATRGIASAEGTR